jgi:hypothetical protein
VKKTKTAMAARGSNRLWFVTPDMAVSPSREVFQRRLVVEDGSAKTKDPTIRPDRQASRALRGVCLSRKPRWNYAASSPPKPKPAQGDEWDPRIEAAIVITNHDEGQARDRKSSTNRGVALDTGSGEAYEHTLGDSARSVPLEPFEHG